MTSYTGVERRTCRRVPASLLGVLRAEAGTTSRAVTVADIGLGGVLLYLTGRVADGDRFSLSFSAGDKGLVTPVLVLRQGRHLASHYAGCIFEALTLERQSRFEQIVEYLAERAACASS